MQKTIRPDCLFSIFFSVALSFSQSSASCGDHLMKPQRLLRHNLFMM